MAKFKIDPGHGAHDPGALGKHSKEKDNVLKVAKRLKTLLESHGHTVSLTRSTDIFIPLSERARQANNWGADYFISLHNNAATSRVSGFETFIHNGPLQSKTAGFQGAIHDAIAKGIGIHDRGKKRANFAVLRETKMPAVLIEYAFISNANDEQILINEVEKLAQLTARGIVNYAGGKPVVPTKKEGNILKLPKWQQDEMALVYGHARDKGVFSSAEHEQAIKDGTMTTHQAIFLMTVISGAALNGGQRIK